MYSIKRQLLSNTLIFIGFLLINNLLWSQYQPLKINGYNKTTNDKMESVIWDIYKTFIEKGKESGLQAAKETSFHIKNDKLKVIVTFQGDLPTIEDLNKLGVKKDNVFIIRDNRIQMMIPIKSLQKLSELPNIIWIEKSASPIPLIVSEGVNVINASNFHDLNCYGRGAKVAIIDIGFAGYEDLLGSELPNSLTTKSFHNDVNGNGDITGNGEKHGTACAEIIFDIAPETQLYLINFESGIEFDLAVDYAIQENLDIISCSIGWANTSNYDGTGDICNTTLRASSNDMLWVNSAGNQARMHYEGVYDDIDSDKFHEFHAEDENIKLFAEEGKDPIQLFLSWDEWPYSNNDYDLLLYDENQLFIKKSDNRQNGNQPPTEAIEYVVHNTGFYNVKIVNYQADGNAKLELYSYNHEFQQYYKSSSSLLDPAPAQSVLAVGATLWTNDELTYYSSQGPTNDGRVKPDLTAPTGVSTQSYPYNFRGTSASCPHVAGAAALILSQNSYLYASQIQKYLENSAKDLYGIGKDNASGYGRLRLVSTNIKFPNGGESLISGQNYLIQWETRGEAVSNVQIKFSIDGGTTFSDIASSIPNNGYSQWLVPQSYSSACKIKVVAKTSNGQEVAEDISDNNFVIESMPASYIYCKTNPSAILANGNTISTINAEIRDQFGNVISSATNQINFSITSGASSGRLIGTNPASAVNGIAEITLQSTSAPGNVTIEATSPGITAGSTVVTVYDNPTEVGGTIDHDITWTLAESPFLVTSDINIAAGAILTIEPGVTVLFNRDRDIFVHGALNANGTQQNPIIFTAHTDNPYPKYWGGIKFYESSLGIHSVLNHCVIYFAGQGGHNNLDSPLILHPKTNPTVTNTTMINNNRNGIVLETGTYSSDITLDITALPYIFRSDLRMSSGATLHIQPGILIKFESGGDIIIDGGMKALGTLDLPITFTSMRDDSHGGDTNGDGPTEGTAGDWGGIVFNQSIMNNNAILDHCTIMYAGQGGHGNYDSPIELHPMANPTLTNISLINNRLNGIDLWTGSYSSNIQLNLSEIPYMIRGDITINESAILKIFPGVLLKFQDGGDFYIKGGLLAQGNPGNHIIFTALRDDLHGGDTNGDGVTQGSPGNWGGIKFDASVSDANCIMNYCDLMYAGSGGYANLDSPIEMDARANPSLTNIFLHENTRNGIDLRTASYSSDIKLDLVEIPYMIRGDITIESSASLMIEPGLTLKFDSGSDLYIRGALKARGNQERHTILTSLKDDSHGGDTNGDGVSSGSKGDWGGIRFYDSVIDNQSILEFCDIMYCGSGGYGNNDCPFVLDGQANPSIQNCFLTNNTKNAINLNTGSYSADFNLDITGFPYLIRGDIIVNSPALLTLWPGVVLKFDGGRNLWIDGSLRAIGTSESPIIFTSIKDDSIGGDSNGDGPTIGSPGDWGGIRFRDSSDDDNCILDRVKFYYGGCGGYGNNSSPLSFDNASPKIERTSILHSKSHGVICYNSSSPDFGGGSKGSEGQNRFFSFKGVSNKYAIYNDGTQDIIARHNFWDTNDSLEIENNIYDKADNGDKGRIYFFPFNAAADVLSPTVNVVQPNGGEQFVIGSDALITWSASDNEGIAKLYFSISRNDGDSYELIDSLFSNPGIHQWRVEPPFSQLCRMKIEASDFSGNIGVDISNGNFAIIDSSGYSNHAPSNVNTLLPINGEESNPNNYLIWSKSTDPDIGDVVTYTLQLDNNPDFSSPEINQSGISGDAPGLEYFSKSDQKHFVKENSNSVYIRILNLQDYSNLVDNMVYFWRVKSCDNHGAESDFTDGTSHFFFNKINSPPNTVTDGFSPRDGLEVRTSHPEISWYPAADPDLSDHAGALNYRIQLDDDGEFTTNHKFLFITPSGINTLEIQVSLTENTNWFYRVQTLDDEGLTSNWSSIQNFWVNAVDEPPSPFALMNPANGSTIPSDTVKFLWTQTNDADPNDKFAYELQFTTDESFQENVTTYNALNDTALSLSSELSENMKYYWKVRAIDSDGLVSWGSNTGEIPWSFEFSSTAVNSELDSKTPTSFVLFQNYPNPFNPETTIQYEIPKSCYVQLTIYNTIGQEIRTLVTENKDAGFYKILWDGRDNSGKKVGTGIYLYQLKAGEFFDVKKMVMIQ